MIRYDMIYLFFIGSCRFIFPVSSNSVEHWHFYADEIIPVLI